MEEKMNIIVNVFAAPVPQAVATPENRIRTANGTPKALITLVLGEVGQSDELSIIHKRMLDKSKLANSTLSNDEVLASRGQSNKGRGKKDMNVSILADVMRSELIREDSSRYGFLERCEDNWLCERYVSHNNTNKCRTAKRYFTIILHITPLATNS
jgi:hypothetical protein